MSDIPLPLSYLEVLGTMIDVMSAKTGIRSFSVGDPILSILETAAHSDIRASQSVFSLLNSSSLETANGSALDKIGKDENVLRIASSKASGNVTFSDSRFTKISTTIYAGKPPVQSGSIIINISSAQQFPSSGQIYIGRGTVNYEGPLTYTSITNASGFAILNLSSPTSRFHNVLETITLAQGGNRTIASNTTVQTSQGAVSQAATYSTLQDAVIVDGEISIENVPVLAQTSGSLGNCIAGAINIVAGAPFPGAVVTNPNSITNGVDLQDDSSYRESIRSARQSRSKGTALALITSAIGVSSISENKIVQSASLLQSPDTTSILYIDDGTGYEESFQGVGLENICNLAFGGEQYFQLVGGRPLTKAIVVTSISAPFSLEEGCILAVQVQDQHLEHTFSSTDFFSINNATAYEVASSINSDNVFPLRAKVADSGSSLTLSLRDDTDVSFQIVAPTSGIDSNKFLGFSNNQVFNLKLYKNDKLLHENGQPAIIYSAPQSVWQSTIGLSSSETFVISVDNTPNQSLTFTASSFAPFGFTSIPVSLAAWADVFNANIAGVTAIVVGDQIALTSNLGANSKSSIKIIDQAGSNSLFTHNMFTTAYATAAVSGTTTTLSSTGTDVDYSLNRNTAQISLTTPLSANDTLSAGSVNTNGYIQGTALSSTLSIGPNAANLWFSVDGAPSILPTLVNGNIVFNVDQSPNGVPLVRFKLTGSTSINGYVAQGDWVVIWDPNLLQNGWTSGAYKIANVGTGAGFDYFEIETPLPGAAFTTTLSNNGIVFVSTNSQIQKVSIPSSTSGISDILASINSQLIGSNATSEFGDAIRVYTNTFDPSGDIMLVAADISGQILGIPVGVSGATQTSHLGFTQTANGYVGTPTFKDFVVNASGLINSSNPYEANGKSLVWERPETAANPSLRIGTNSEQSQEIQSIASAYNSAISSTSWDGTNITITVSSTTGLSVGDYVYLSYSNILLLGSIKNNSTYLVNTIVDGTHFKVTFYSNDTGSSITTAGSVYKFNVTLRTNNNLAHIVQDDRYESSSHYAICPNDTLSVIIDGEAISQNYSIPLFRSVTPASGNYTQNSVPLLDKDNLDGSGNPTKLYLAFGNNFDFSDYAVYMQGRCITHPSVGANTAIWRYARFGPEGNNATLVYNYPTGANQPVSLSWINDNQTAISILLASGSARTNPGLTNDSALAVAATVGSSSVTLTYCASLASPATDISGAGSGANVVISIPWANFPTGFTGTHDLLQFVNTSSSYVYISGGDVALPSGTYKVLATSVDSSDHVSTMTISATTSSPYISATNYNIYFTYNPTATAINSNFTSAGIINNDIVFINSLPGFSTGYKNIAYRIIDVQSNYFSVMAASTVSTSGQISTPIINTSNISFYQLNASANTVANLVSLISTNFASILSGQVGAGNGTGTISLSTLDEYGNSTANPQFYQLSGGVNHVQSSSINSSGALSNITFKMDPTVLESTISGSNTINWTSEELRLVPITVKSLLGYLNSPAVSGIYSNSTIAASNDFQKLQITTKVPGSNGSVQVSGGTGNSTQVSVIGTAIASLDSTRAIITIPQSSDIGLGAYKWVSLQAGSVQAKSVSAFTDSAQSLTVTTSSGTSQITRSSSTSNFGTILASCAATSWVVEKIGNFAKYSQNKIDSDASVTHFNKIPNLTEGYLVYINSASAFSTQNKGLFRIVRLDDKGFWVENINAKSEIVTTVSTSNVVLATYDSVMPGDTFSVMNSVLGVSNVGKFTVTEYSMPSSGVITFFTVLGTMSAIGPVSLSGFTSGLQVLENIPRKLFKYIKGIAPNAQNSASFTDVIVDSSAYATQISAASNTILTVLDKLEFPIDLQQGSDAYSYNLGLIEEVNKVIYGVEDDTATYPGVIAAGTNMDISGPIVKRIQISLAIRASNLSTQKTIQNRVRGAVTGVINGTGVGKSIAISDIISAAKNIDGVVAISIINPLYSSSNDLITIQPFEKPLVINPDNDIQINFI